MGGGFKHNDVVEVEVDRANNTIKYSVSNTLKATQTNSILGDGSRVFYPYVEFNHHEDSVEWLFYWKTKLIIYSIYEFINNSM